MYDLGTFQTAAFVMGPGVSESAGEPFKDGNSGTMILLHISPIGFQSQMFWGFVSLVQVPRVELPDLYHRPLNFRKKLCVCKIFPDCESLHQGWFFFW